MGLNELDSRHKKTTKVLDLSGFDVFCYSYLTGTAYPKGVGGGS